MNASMSDSLVYQTVFDTARVGFHTWRASVFGLPFIAGGVYIAWLVHRSNEPRSRLRLGKLGAAAAILIGTYVCVATFVQARSEYGELQDALRSGHYQVVEGIVSEFTPQGPGSHPPESWSVAGHRYTFYSAITSAFAESGRVHAGDRVRIADVRGQIARLEIAR